MNLKNIIVTITVQVYYVVDYCNYFLLCTGLSEGLHEVDVADSRWAIEFEPSAAQAYRLNNPGAVVFNADCNHILKLIMEVGIFI